MWLTFCELTHSVLTVRLEYIFSVATWLSLRWTYTLGCEISKRPERSV